MRIESKDIYAIYKHLFTEGCLVAFKEFTCNHPVFNIPNLQVVMLMKGLVSRQMVKETMNWRCLYWTLNDSGIEFLKQKLCLPDDAIPNTLKAPTTQSVIHEEAKQLQHDRRIKKSFPSDKKPAFK
ncbi:40S ribosomal protein S10 [Entamoeba marina]